MNFDEAIGAVIQSSGGPSVALPLVPRIWKWWIP